MRHIKYPAWLKWFLWSLFIGGVSCAIWPPTLWLGWGMLIQTGYLLLGYVCIYMAELESDLILQAKQDVGDWNREVVALSKYRMAHHDRDQEIQALQDFNRLFWREYLKARRYLLRSTLKTNPDWQARYQACNQQARDWLNHLQTKLGANQVHLEAGDQDYLERMASFHEHQMAQSLIQ